MYSNKPVIFIDANIPLLDKALNGCGTIHRFKGRELKNIQLIESGCTHLFIRSTTKVNKELLKGTLVKFVGTATSGCDHVDVEYLNENEIVFAYSPGSNANSVAEYVIYSVLKFHELNKISIKNSSIGIIGYGNIGKIVACYSHNLGMKVLINDPPLKEMGTVFPKYVRHISIEELFKKVNIITNHVPLTSSGIYATKNLFNKDLIEDIKPGSLFIHTSRGGVVDEQALKNKLKNDNITTVIDVWEDEPRVNAELAALSLISTSHIAGYSYDGKVKGVLQMLSAFEQAFGVNTVMSEVTQALDENKLFHIEDFTHEGEILSLLHEKRRFDVDHYNFMETMKLKAAERSAAFDELRKKYPVRRESITSRHL
jgi:erythronate-4-phosphate dehydrogenase